LNGSGEAHPPVHLTSLERGEGVLIGESLTVEPADCAPRRRHERSESGELVGREEDSSRGRFIR
jgi:hypothetical protein